MATPEQVDVWVGLDVGKEEHFAEVLDDDGERLFARSWSTTKPPSRRCWTGPPSTARPDW